MSDYSIDDVDRQIIKCLAENGRVSNREIARRLDLTEGAIRARLKRLETDDIVRISAVVNVNRLELPVLAFLWIDVAPGHSVSEVARCMAELPRNILVRTLIGRADILAMTFVKDAAHLQDYLHSTVNKVPGVHETRFSYSRNILKHDYQFTSII